MKFAHLADSHLGGWREPKLKEANAKAFTKTINICIQENVDFVLISGDLFNSAVPAIESLQHAVHELMKLKKTNIPVYAIPGSHDFSPSGKTMLDVLESAHLLLNVVRGTVIDEKLHLQFTTDTKTGVKITGMLGKKGGLEKHYYAGLHTQHLEAEPGYKIFMFHSAIEELKPKGMEQMEGMAGSLLPKGFNYYAGGHVHVTNHAELQDRHNIVYPGPVFPNNFAELEKLKTGTFCIVENESIRQVPIEENPLTSIQISADHKEPAQVEEEVFTALKKITQQNTIITIRVQGLLAKGKPTDINWQRIQQSAFECGAYIMLKNTSQLISPEMIEVKVPNKSIEEIEEAIITENPCKTILKSTNEDKILAKELMQSMQQEKNEGERTADFEGRIISLADAVTEENN
ncbi:MAG: exonuclease SbcCD subunit D [Candidatus Aenigmarchaeota archaeon]|nr:exonuclease SbcCD subunit D [Candidatus Aenigmarchaeota archaeon]